MLTRSLFTVKPQSGALNPPPTKPPFLCLCYSPAVQPLQQCSLITTLPSLTSTPPPDALPLVHLPQVQSFPLSPQEMRLLQEAT